MGWLTSLRGCGPLLSPVRMRSASGRRLSAQRAQVSGVMKMSGGLVGAGLCCELSGDLQVPLDTRKLESPLTLCGSCSSWLWCSVQCKGKRSTAFAAHGLYGTETRGYPLKTVDKLR